jgi:hypothetical protein
MVTDYLGSLYRGVDLFRTRNAHGLLHQLAGDVGLPDCISRSAAPYKEAQLRSRILGTCEMAVLDPCVGKLPARSLMAPETPVICAENGRMMRFRDDCLGWKCNMRLFAGQIAGRLLQMLFV